MKRFMLFFSFLLCVLASSAQAYTQKWNDVLKRTEFFDRYGALTGWAKYNNVYKRMEYFKNPY